MNTATILGIISTFIGLASTIIAVLAIVSARGVHDSQKLLSQRQLIVQIWDKIARLRDVDPSAPITPQVLDLVNTLELIALCVEGQAIDEQIIFRTFRTQYMRHYRSIQACKDPLPGMKQNGEALLRENPAAIELFKRLEREEESRDRVTRGV